MSASTLVLKRKPKAVERPKRAEPLVLKSKRDPWVLAGFIAVTQAAGLLGALWTNRSVGTWYRRLDKPGFTPPGWVFAPVWTTLYTMIGISGYQLWRRRANPLAKVGLGLWGVQLAENTAWSYLFFDQRRPRAALVDLGALFATSAAYTAVTWPVSRGSSLLFMPYLGWLGYAGALNASIVRRN